MCCTQSLTTCKWIFPIGSGNLQHAMPWLAWWDCNRINAAFQYIQIKRIKRKKNISKIKLTFNLLTCHYFVLFILHNVLDLFLILMTKHYFIQRKALLTYHHLISYAANQSSPNLRMSLHFSEEIQICISDLLVHLFYITFSPDWEDFNCCPVVEN